jgi:arabinogalactan endo-1,4-beta-galactosidase
VVVEVEGMRMDVRFIDNAGAVRDSFAILKNAGPQFVRPSICNAQLVSRE